MKGLTFKKALDLSIKKWERIVETEGKVLSFNDTIMLDIDGLNSYCGLCEYFREATMDLCANCPLNDNPLDDSYFGFEEIHICCKDWQYWMRCEDLNWDIKPRDKLYWAKIILNSLYEFKMSLRGEEIEMPSL